MIRFFSQLLTRSAAFTHDLLMIPVAWLGAYWLRFNLNAIPAYFLDQALWLLLVIVPLQTGVFWFFGLYRGVWRFASLPDLIRILKAIATGLLLTMTAAFVATRLQGVPRSVPLLYGLLLIVLLSGPRFVYRWIKDRHFKMGPGKRVLIVGAGKAGEMLVRDLLRNRQAFQPIAFVDDKPKRRGSEVHGLPVLGGCNAIPQLVDELSIDIIMLAVPSAKANQMQRLVELSEHAGVPFRTVPKLADLMSGQFKINQLREVSIEDLLGRDPVSLDWSGIQAGLSEKIILITGAGGSIGSELCRQIARIKPQKLVLFENSEYNLYSIELELRQSFPELDLGIHLGDIVDKPAIEKTIELHRPHVVFHAAAYKHVPLLEPQVREAIRNNVFGTRVVADAAVRHGCEEFVLISTDKAVNPANVMGASKRVAEIYCQNLNARSRTRFITVRFGNVLGSAGSVVPLFQKQIAAGGPVTVTHRDMKRYFMTIPEACQLIMQAAVLGEGSEIFVLDMDDPVEIVYLAEQMIRLSGKTPWKEIQIRYTGLRPGEKLYEELFHEREKLVATRHNKILLAHHREVNWDMLNTALDNMQVACERFDEDRLLQLLVTLVPEHTLDQPIPPPKAVPDNVIPLKETKLLATPEG